MFRSIGKDEDHDQDGLACHNEVARSVAGRGRSCRTALAIAREKADDRGIQVEFAAADAFQLERLGRRFETVLDCGLFHTFDGDERLGPSPVTILPLKSSRSRSFSASGISRPLLREASCPRTVCKLLQNAESTCSGLPSLSLLARIVLPSMAM